MKDFIDAIASLVLVTLALVFTTLVLVILNPLFWVGLTLIIIFKMVS